MRQRPPLQTFSQFGQEYRNKGVVSHAVHHMSYLVAAALLLILEADLCGVKISSLLAAVSRIVTTWIFPNMLCRHFYCYWHIQHCCIASSSILCAFGVSKNLI